MEDDAGKLLGEQNKSNFLKPLNFLLRRIHTVSQYWHHQWSNLQGKLLFFV